MNTTYNQETFKEFFGYSHVKIQLSVAVPHIEKACARHNSCSTKLEGIPTKIEEDGILFRLHKAEENDTFKVPYDKMKTVTKMDF